jgi:hypothetical protein
VRQPATTLAERAHQWLVDVIQPTIALAGGGEHLVGWW